MKCLNCKAASDTFDPYLDIALDIKVMFIVAKRNIDTLTNEFTPALNVLSCIDRIFRKQLLHYLIIVGSAVPLKWCLLVLSCRMPQTLLRRSSSLLSLNSWIGRMPISVARTYYLTNFSHPFWLTVSTQTILWTKTLYSKQVTAKKKVYTISLIYRLSVGVRKWFKPQND